MCFLLGFSLLFSGYIIVFFVDYVLVGDFVGFVFEF